MPYTVTPRGSVLTAADAAASDYFGASVSLSSDGLVMAVGASTWEGAITNQGGVYIYDWTGGAWVQRGAVLVAADALYGNEKFGASVSLSADGSILAVGSISQDAPGSESTYAGAVYIYDWSGSAWVQRGSAFTSATAQFEFGNAVALSSDGLVLAVGQEQYWVSGLGQIGRCHVFDWSGTAWTERTPFNAADAGDYDYFGAGVALSSDGLILAVGASHWDGALSDQGGVYVYDWTGGVWGQRGSVLVAPDAAANDNFGASVSLSADGTLLAVGAENWENATSDAGSAYLFDLVGGVWTQSGSVIEAADAATWDGFGAAVALAPAKAVLAIGAYRWEGALSDQGGVYVYDCVAAVEPLYGTPTAPTLLTMLWPTGTSTAPTALTVSNPTGTPTAPTRLIMTATGSASAPALLAMIAPAPAVPAVAGVPGVVWSARCLIDGVDVSAQLVGQASVTAAEGAARIASVTLRPPAGLVAPLDYVGKSIALDYVQVIDATEVPRRLFTGRVDTPAYDPDSTLLTLTCTDDLQNVVAALPRTTVSHLVGGRFTEAVQGELDDEWDYAQARLTTVAGSLDASASGGLRTTLWDSGSTWATFTESELIYRRMQLTLPQRSTLINKVEIGFDYRFMRLHQRQTTVGWSGTQPEMAKNGYQYPTQQDILGAAEGTGWTVTQGIFYPAPTAIPVEIPVGSSLLSGFFYPPDGSIDMAVLHLAHRHSQTVTERYTITVTAGESVAVNGELPSALRGALASDFSGSAWESALDVVPLMPEGGVQDYAPDADRDAADYAIQTLLDQARVKILSSHRSGRVGNAILCNPDLDLDKRVAIDTAQVSAAGKVALLVHVLDFESGSATTEFSLAISGVGGDGSSTPDVLAPPPPRMFVDHSLDWVYEIPPLACHTYGVTAYDEGLMGLLLNPSEGILVEDIPYYGSINAANPFYVEGSYPVTGFRMQMPGVDDADRNPIDDPVAASYSIIVPTDTLTFTVP